MVDSPPASLQQPCAFCRSAAAPLALRPSVPPEFLADSTFDIDPLGSAGAGFALCPDCSRLLAAPMLLAEDAEAFAKAVALHREAHAPAGDREAFAARLRLWHRALHLGLRALVGELEAAPLPVVVRPEPDQLGLFSSRASRLAKVLAALESGRLEVAASAAAEVAARFDLPEASYLARHLPVLAARLESMRLDPELLALALEVPGELFEPERSGELLADALRRVLHARVADAAERCGLCEVHGRLSGWHWLRAGMAERARAAFDDAARRQPQLSARALFALGDLEFGQGRLAEAREHYRQALCEEAGGVDPESAADPAVQGLADEARELELEPPLPWLPLVGWVAGVFGLPPEPEGLGPCREFHRALLAGRRGGGVEARRRMKELAPRLFERLRDEGRL
ncbi:MAG TPA: tetratricopeptide repeat protein [Myxococcales bacterium]|jgi:tetratricopeptide (TPR) repeat protein